MKSSMSITKGKGSINHNKRKFKAPNVDPARSHLNITLIDEDVKEVYKTIFNESLIEYNSKQQRSDRKINNYYDHINHSKQEKPFYELIIQLGDMENSQELNEISPNILSNFVGRFKKKYQNIYVTGAYIHLDESTPHLHLDYIPVAYNQKRGLKTRNSHNLAMKQMGYSDYRFWRADLMTDLEEIAKDYHIERKNMKNTAKHININQYRPIIQELKKHISTEISEQSVPEFDLLNKSEKIGNRGVKADFYKQVTKNYNKKSEELTYASNIIKIQDQELEIYSKKGIKALMNENMELHREIEEIKIKNQSLENENILLKDKSTSLDEQNCLFKTFLDKLGINTLFEQFVALKGKFEGLIDECIKLLKFNSLKDIENNFSIDKYDPDITDDLFD